MKRALKRAEWVFIIVFAAVVVFLIGTSVYRAIINSDSLTLRRAEESFDEMCEALGSEDNISSVLISFKADYPNTEFEYSGETITDITYVDYLFFDDDPVTCKRRRIIRDYDIIRLADSNGEFYYFYTNGETLYYNGVEMTSPSILSLYRSALDSVSDETQNEETIN